MLKNFFKILTIFCLLIKGVSAAPLLEIRDYDEPVDFTNKKVVLIQKGDLPEFKEPGYSDEDWTLVSLPSSWHLFFPQWRGICWYRLHIKFPDRLPDRSLGVSLGIISDVDEVFLNGHLIGKSGSFPPERKSAYDRKRMYEIPTKMIIPGKVNIIAIRVAGLFPNEKGPYQGEFKISSFQNLQKEYLSKEFLDVFFVVIYMVVGIYFVLIFVRSSVDKEYLFFSLFTLTSALYLFLRTQIKYLISENFLELKRIEYLVLFIILVLMMEYITFFFKKRHSILHFVYFGITLISLILVILSNDAYFWNQTLLYVVEPAWLIPIVYCVYISIKEFKNSIEAKYILIAFAIIWIIFINDVLVDRGVYNFVRLSNYGFLFIIIGTAIIMRKRFLRLFDEVEDFRTKKIKKTRITDDTKSKLEEAIAYLGENYKSDISREGLAEAIGINPDYLGKIFIDHTGKRIHDYINELRIKKAIKMLLEDDANVTNIAFSVGFESLSTFYRVFQNIMDESPTSYRERNRHQSS